MAKKRKRDQGPEIIAGNPAKMEWDGIQRDKNYREINKAKFKGSDLVIFVKKRNNMQSNITGNQTFTRERNC